jgi:hypothetical protein
MIMRRSKLFAASFGTLLSVGMFVSLPFLTSACTSIASPQKPVSELGKISMPDSLNAKILEDLRTRLGLPQPAADYLKIVKVEALPPESLDPAVTSVPRWRVIIEAQKQSWVYVAAQDNSIYFDAVASLPDPVRTALSKKLGVSVKDLKIKAAELVTTMRQCPINSGCMMGYELKWRILPVTNSTKIYNFDNYGQEWQRWSGEKNTSAGLPLGLKSAVMSDVIDRMLVIPPNLNVESIKAVTWSDCSGGLDSPTRIPRGTCANFPVSGWQMRVRSGAILYTYYVQPVDPRDYAAIAKPDGGQSIQPSLIELVKQDITKQSKTSVQNFHVKQVQPQYFNRCLDASGQDCQNGIQAGWAITVGGNLDARGDNFWLYYVSLNGEQIRFVQTGVYANPA